MNTLTDILLVLVFAKAAAEIAERIGVPAVVGEIVAGIAIGPSVLGWVGTEEVLTTLGEIGVILLLLEVGMQMDLRELRSVGRAALSVASVGVVVPFALGYVTALALNLGSDTALFLGAALSATSVGITARVFGDLGVLATIESRTVLGAAVADDVIGLVILTVVVRLVTGSGELSAVGIGSIIAVALLFLVGTTVVGTLGVPRIFRAIDRYSRSAGTLFALALAFALGLAWLATKAELAPIIGAFVAGLCLGRSHVAERIQVELTPVGHLFIPVFFLQIGINSDITRFANGTVILIALCLLAVAIVGKLVSGWATIGLPMDRLIVGVGMVPRGEVGLIFATIGLSTGVLNDDTYAALLAVVLGSTLLTPPALRLLVTRRAATLKANRPAPSSPPIGGWLEVDDGSRVGSVALRATPPDQNVVELTFQVAATLERHEPDQALVAWIMSARDAAVVDPANTEALIALLERGGPRGWRFLESTGILERAFPALASSLQRRRMDPALLDPGGHLRWPLLERTRRLLRGDIDHPWDASAADVARRLSFPRSVLIAAFIVDAVRDEADPDRAAADLVAQLRLLPNEAGAVGALVMDRSLLRAASVRPDGMSSAAVYRLAAHLRASERVRELQVLTTGLNAPEKWEQALLDQLCSLLIATLDGQVGEAGLQPLLIEQRRARSTALVQSATPASERIALAPVGLILMESPEETAEIAAYVDPVPAGRNMYKVRVRASGPEEWRIDIVARDRLGLLGITTGVLEAVGLNVLGASIATWPDRAAVQAFRVTNQNSTAELSSTAIQQALEAADGRALVSAPVSDATVEFDDDASPWHTIAEVRATDRPGLLHALSVAFAAAGADVHDARVSTSDEMAYDRFDLTDRSGRKLDDTAKQEIRAALQQGVVARPWRPWATNRVGIVPKQSGD